MFKTSFRTFIQLCRKYPVEFLMNLTACAVLLSFDQYLNYYGDDAYLFGVLFTYPLYFSVAYLTNYYQSRWYKWTLLYMPLMSALCHYVPLSDNESFWLGMYLIHILIFFSKGLPYDNRQFMQNILLTMVNFALAWALAATVLALFWLLDESVDYLFGIDLFFRGYTAKINTLIFLFFTPLFFLILEERTEKNIVPERLFFAAEILINYLLSPVVIIYTLLVYIYIAMILFAFELPQGNVSIIVLSYLILGLVCIALRQLTEKPKWEAFFCHFAKLSLIPLGLLWLGIFVRVENYGLTVSRIYLITIAALVTLFIVCSLVQKWQRYRWFGLFTIAATVLITMVLSPEKIEAESQKKQFVSLAKELKLMDSAGKLQLKGIDPAKLDRKKLERLSYFAADFYNTLDYDENDLNDIRQLYNEAHNIASPYLPPESEEVYFHYSRTEGDLAIPLADYQEFVLVANYAYRTVSQEDDSIIVFEHRGTEKRFTIKASVIDEILAKHGVEPGKAYPAKVLKKAAAEMQALPTEQGVTLVFHNFALSYLDDLKRYHFADAAILGYFKP